MRIIGGKYRGRKLKSISGTATRPTADRVREALFDVLGEMVKGARVLDLFAGTGALGLEAISRGASEAVLVENNPAARAAIESNLAALSADEAVRLLPLDCRSALALLGKRGDQFDLILADPPYWSREAENLLDLVGRSAILARDGMVVIEHPVKSTPGPSGPGWALIRRKEYGRTALSFLVPSPPRDRQEAQKR